MSHNYPQDSTDESTQTIERSDLAIGDRVVDGDEDKRKRAAARVVEAPELTAEEYHIDAMGETVAAVNPEHPSDARVVGIQFERGNGQPGGQTYHYPATRLMPISEEWEAPESMSEGARERAQLIEEHPEAIEAFETAVRRLLCQPKRCADDLAEHVETAETRGDCRFTKDDSYRDGPEHIICWECSSQPYPQKFMADDPAADHCPAIEIHSLPDWCATVSEYQIDAHRIEWAIRDLRSGDTDRIRRTALKLGYRVSGLQAIEEYNYSRALALLRDRGVADELPIIGSGERGGDSA